MGYLRWPLYLQVTAPSVPSFVSAMESCLWLYYYCIHIVYYWMVYLTHYRLVSRRKEAIYEEVPDKLPVVLEDGCQSHRLSTGRHSFTIQEYSILTSKPTYYIWTSIYCFLHSTALHEMAEHWPNVWAVYWDHILKLCWWSHI